MRLRLLRWLICGCFLFLFLCLAYNQVLRGPYYSRLSRNNRIKLIRLPASRGLICDRQGEVLAGRRLVFNAALLAQETQDIRRAFNQIAPSLGLSREELLRRFKKDFLAPFIPVVVARDISQETAITLECKESDIPGLIIQTEALRDYRYSQAFSHILGYLGRISEDELARFKVYGYQARDLMGRSGIEEEFDRYLKGQPGGMQIEVDNQGKKVRVLGQRLPQGGKDLYLTIDGRLQRYVDNLLEEAQGVCIVMNPQNGEILSMVSKPGFDPNLFIEGLSARAEASRRINQLFSSKEAPLLNRAISAAYPPGSIFKIAVAAEGLEAGKISPAERLNCRGTFAVGEREFLCWKLEGHGSEDIYSGLAHSCNVFFYKLGLALRADRLTRSARRFGLGSLSGIDLPNEKKGLVPSKAWKMRVHRDRWYDGETANFSIGQGYLLTTPLQIARMVSAIANNGYLIRPHVVKKIAGEETGVFRKKLPLGKETLEIIKEGMRQAVQSEQGTAHQAAIAGAEWAGKTGTAQTATGQAHGWFAGFYPLKQARILVLVFLEYGGSGAEAPTAIGKRILEYIIENKM